MHNRSSSALPVPAGLDLLPGMGLLQGREAPSVDWRRTDVLITQLARRPPGRTLAGGSEVAGSSRDQLWGGGCASSVPRDPGTLRRLPG